MCFPDRLNDAGGIKGVNQPRLCLGSTWAGLLMRQEPSESWVSKGGHKRLVPRLLPGGRLICGPARCSERDGGAGFLPNRLLPNPLSKVRWPLEKGRGWGILFGSIINLGADPDCLGILLGSIIILVGPRIVFRLPSHPFPVSGPCHHPLTHAHCSSTPYPRDCCPWCSFLTFLELLPVGDLVSSVNSAPPTTPRPHKGYRGKSWWLISLCCAEATKSRSDRVDTWPRKLQSGVPSAILLIILCGNWDATTSLSASVSPSLQWVVGLYDHSDPFLFPESQELHPCHFSQMESSKGMETPVVDTGRHTQNRHQNKSVAFSIPQAVSCQHDSVKKRLAFRVRNLDFLKFCILLAV